MTAPTTQAQLGYIAPFFIVRDVMPAIAFYKDRLGFKVTFLGPEDDPYFAMLKRDGVRLICSRPSRPRCSRRRIPAGITGPSGTRTSIRLIRTRWPRSSHPVAFCSGSLLATTRTNCAGSKSWMRTGTVWNFGRHLGGRRGSVASSPCDGGARGRAHV